AAAVHRSADEREPWHPEHALTREQALVASAGALHVDEGGAADLVVLEADPLHCVDSALVRMPVTATLVAGRFTHRTL
ncbi:MAG: amidohydrolase, partial [Demequina sp.]